MTFTLYHHIFKHEIIYRYLMLQQVEWKFLEYNLAHPELFRVYEIINFFSES